MTQLSSRPQTFSFVITYIEFFKIALSSTDARHTLPYAGKRSTRELKPSVMLAQSSNPMLIKHAQRTTRCIHNNWCGHDPERREPGFCIVSQILIRCRRQKCYGTGTNLHSTFCVGIRNYGMMPFQLHSTSMVNRFLSFPRPPFRVLPLRQARSSFIKTHS